MRKLLATAMMMTGMSGAAFAADLPSRMAPPVYAPPPPIFTWSGFYLGANAGYAFDYRSRVRTFDDPTVPATTAVGVAAGTRPGLANVNSDGFTGGGQIGYNYQFGAGSGVVVGVEADAAYTDLGKTNNIAITDGAGVTRVTSLHSDMDFLGTVRGRLGYAFDRFLVYGTGGFAYGDVTQRANFFSGAGVLNYTGSRSSIQTGYTYGGGIEYALPTGSFLNFFNSSAVTIKAEYLHYDLGTAGLAVGAVAAGSTGTYTQRIKTDGDLARVGINYKF